MLIDNNGMEQPPKTITTEQKILCLGQVLQRLKQEDNLDALIEITIAYLQEQFDYQLIWIAIYDRLNHTLFGKGGITPDNDISFGKKQVVLNSGDLLEQVVIEKSLLTSDNLREETRATQWQEIAAKYQIQGTIILPICYSNCCVGLMLLGSQSSGNSLSGEIKPLLQIVLSELGVALYQNEIDSQQQIRHPERRLLQLVENLRTLTNLDQKLETVVEATHQFLGPTRTNIYWFERQGRYFWCRMSNHLLNLGRDSHPQTTVAGITVQELNDFYYALALNQVVWIGESSSSLNSRFTGKLMQRLQVQSLLAAPIFLQKDLLGFLAAEGLEPRIWTQGDKNFIQGAAGLISLIAPIDKVEDRIRQIQQDSQLTSQLTQAVHNRKDVHETLRLFATRVLERLAANRFVVLHYDSDHDNYQVLYQISPHNRRPWTFTFNPLTETDIQLLQTATQAVEIENLDNEDLRFVNWHQPFQESGGRSFLVCNCTQGHPPDTVLLITHETNRSWASQEKELLWVFSQQIGVIVRQWQLRISHKQQQKISQIFTQCLDILAQNQGDSTKAFIEKIAAILDCPLALLISWFPDQEIAEIIPGVISDHQFEIIGNVSIPIQGEALIQQTVAEENYLILQANDLASETRKWLNVPESSQVLSLAMRATPNEQPTGVVLLADYQERYWSEPSLCAIVTLVNYLAWWRRQNQINQLLTSTTEKLWQLNWYKNSRLEEIQRIGTLLLSQIHDLGIPGNELTQMRYRLLLRQLNHITGSMTGIVKQEQWQLHVSCETMTISNLLKRSLDRVDNLLKQQQMWVSVHGLRQPIENGDSPKSTSALKGVFPLSHQSTMAIMGDIVKIELVIHEVLVAACHRSQPGSKIDIWCRQLDEQLLELLITDNGAIEPHLLVKRDHNLLPSDLQPPSLHLLICQKLMQQLGGALDLSQLPDQRVASRLLLPLAPRSS